MALGSSAMPFSTRWMAMLVCLASSSSIMLLKSGERCCTTTKAKPESVGMWVKKAWSASSPPAEAPMPMM